MEDSNAAGGDTTGRTAGTTNRKAVPSFVLPPVVRRIVEQMESSEFVMYKSDFEYMEAVAAVESARILAFNMDQGMKMSFFRLDTGGRPCKDDGDSQAPSNNTANNKTGDDDPTILSIKQLVDSLVELTDKLEAYRVQQLSKMTKKPLVEAFLDEMDNANDNQRKVFRFVLACNSGMTGYAKTRSSPGMDGANSFMWDILNSHMDLPTTGLAAISSTIINTQLLNALFQIPILELFDMANPKSIWVREQIYGDCKADVSRSFLINITWKTAPFLGLEMGVNDFEALESEVLKQALLNDPLFVETATGKALLKMKRVEENEQPLGGQPGDGGMMHIRKGDDKNGSKEFDFMEAFQKAQDASGGKRESALDILSMARGMAAANVVDSKESNEKEWTDVAPSSAVTNRDDNPRSKQESDDENKLETYIEATEALVMEEYGPYKSDLQYLEDQVRIMEQARLLNRMKSSLRENKFKEDEILFRDKQQQERNRYYGDPSFGTVQLTDAQKDEQQRTIERLTLTNKKLQARVQTRIAATTQETGREMRLEQLCQALKLSTFERYVILSLLKGIIVPVDHRGDLTSYVGSLIDSFCVSLEEKMKHRAYFYRSGSLIREGIIAMLQPDFKRDLTLCTVELDRRMFDFLVALDTEFSEIVEGSHLYLPTVVLDDVVLPEDTKKRVHDVVMNFDQLRQKILEYEVQDKISYGLGQILLFHGKSGTGKTMLANAVAAKAKKKVLLCNFPALGANSSGAIIKMLFREASINNALLFFDECESLFRSRSRGGISITTILSEIERFEGLCIMATNLPVEIDEAVHRRVSLAVEFRKPDHFMREAIWKKLHPPKVPIADDIDFGLLAHKFELTGGHIKNCWVSALSLMVEKGTSTISQEDLMQAAREQVLGQLSMEDFDRKVVPTHGVDSLVVSDTVRDALNGIVQARKASSVLFGNWGFDKLHRSTMGVSAMFTGPPGTGKTMAAEAVGYELGSPLLVVNVAELVSKWVGETGKNIEAIFAAAKKKDAVLVFDEAEGLFGTRASSTDSSTSRHDNMNVGLLLHKIESFSGICIVITNLRDAIDDAFFRRFRFVVSFEEPGVAEREKIWKQMVPEACPIHSDVSFTNLASRFELKGGEIKQALMRAATKAALRSEESKRIITMADLEIACRQEHDKKGRQLGSSVSIYM